MLRTGYSTIIKESQDFTFAIFDGAGRMVAQGIPQPLHIGPLAAQVNEIRRRFRDATEPGDAFIVNHPYQACQNHATDVTVISPMFIGGRLVGFIGNIAHKPDLGGKVPGTNSGDATDLFQEGLLIPPMKIIFTRHSMKLRETQGRRLMGPRACVSLSRRKCSVSPSTRSDAEMRRGVASSTPSSSR